MPVYLQYILYSGFGSSGTPIGRQIQCIVILLAEGKERLDKFPARSLPKHSRTKLVKLIEEGVILVDGTAVKPSFMLEPGMSVALDEPGETDAHDLTPADIPLE